MAAGRPVIATGVGGLVEAIEDDVTGLLVAPGDPGAMAAAIQALLMNPERAEKMGTAGKERMAHEFSVERMVTETESLYDELLGRARG
jgi:type III pantothenate kinase